MIPAIQALRPKQWVKNVLLLAALVFSMAFDDVHQCFRAGIAVLSFSMLASAGYLLNDSRDREADARHPKKRFRPIASGRLSLSGAYTLMGLCFASGIALAWFLSPAFLIVASLYFITTLTYSLYFKHIVILDVMVLASCYVWRAAAGAVAIDVHVSPWLLLCTAFLALFLGFNKRRGEQSLVGGQAGTRKTLDAYSPALVTEFQAITTSGTIISYALYLVLASPTPWLLLTLPCVLYGIFRYIYLVQDRGEGGAPDETLLQDVPILVAGALYAATTVIVLWATQA